MPDLDPQAFYHRTLDGWLSTLPYTDYLARKDVFDEAAQKTGTTLGTAYRVRERKLVPLLYVVKKDQDFKSYATKWELYHSKLVFGAGHGTAEPVVDDNMTVTGHVAWFKPEELFIPAKEAAVTRKELRKYTPPSRPIGNILLDWDPLKASEENKKRMTPQYFTVEHRRQIGTLLGDGVEMFADKSEVSYLSRGYVRTEASQFDFRIVTDPEGRALFLAGWRDPDAIDSSWVTPLDLFSIVKLVALASTAIIGMVGVRMLARQVTARTLRGVLARETEGAAADALTGTAAGDAANAAGGGARTTLRGIGAQSLRDGAGGAGNVPYRTGNTLRGIGAQGAREAGSGSAARTAVRETVTGPFRRRAGRMSVDEMEAYLKQVLEHRPDLRRLMAARMMTGQGRMDAIKAALKEFEDTQHWKVVEKTAAEMEAVTTRNNIVHMRAETRELWINSERAARYDPEKYYEHVVHDLSAHALAGRGGSLDETVLPHLFSQFNSRNNGLAILEEAIHRGNLEAVIASYR